MTPAGTNLLLAHADAAPAPSDVVTKSLRFNGSDSPILTRTPSSSGSQRIFTLSFWVKRSVLSSTNYETIWASEASGYNYMLLTYYTDGLRFQSHGLGETPTLQSNAVFRDVSAWYHIVLSVDTTQATDTNRVKIYVNGSAITFSSATYPTLNYDLQVNTSSYTNKIGYSAGTSQYFDGYLADVNFIDGEQLTPTSFAEEDATTGQWKPKAFDGVYGTNGFHLDFKDSSDIGKDVSVSAYITATGGTVTTDGDYKVHTFNSSGTFEVTNTSTTGLEYLVIAGGGSGGWGNNGSGRTRNAGGGGAGGYLTSTAHSVTVQSYTVTIGAGGAASTIWGYRGDSGTDSTFSSFTSIGGGAGGGSRNEVPLAGGSGGGGGTTIGGASATSGQGNSGGAGSSDGTSPNCAGGGGGGAGGAGNSASGDSGGNGGNGSSSSINGVSTARSGGGGGSGAGSDGAGGTGGGGTAGGSGTVNTGGGGGADVLSGAAGGSGCVIIRYKFQ